MSSLPLAPDHQQTTHAFVACVLRQCGLADEVAAPLKAPLRPAKVFPSGHDYVAVSGGAQHQFEGLRESMAQWFGAPKITENRMGDMLIGQRAEFPNKLSLVYLADRDGGISMSFPKALLPSLHAKWQEAQPSLSTPAERGR